MKGEKFFSILTAAVLASLLAVGAVGCLVTAFDLEVQSLNRVFWVCVGAALVFSALYAWKWGPAAALCGMALLAGWLWHRGIFLEQLTTLLVRISRVYHNAYHWGYFLFAEGDPAADYPLGVLGALIALAAGASLVRGRDMTLPLLFAAVPLAACVVVTDTVPEPKFLFILFLGFLLCMIPQSVRRENVTQGCRLTAMIALPVILALAALFLCIPQEGYVNRSEEIQTKILAFVEELPSRAQEKVQQISSGIAEDGQENLNLKQLGPRPRYTHSVMQVTADETGTLYLRGQDYDAYTGIGWTASPHRAEPFGMEGEAAGTVTVATDGKKDLLFLPYYPVEQVTLAGGALKNNDGKREYTIAYGTLPENWQEEPTAPVQSRIELTNLEISQFGSTADRLRYVTLPGKTKVQAEAILEAILPENASRFETAEIIGEFVMNSAEYDLNTRRMPGEAEDFALWFLEESETGYCVHFATAAVVLLRAADIPARYVTGYMTRTEAGQTVTVTAGEAHAWAEYYVPQLETWVILEATPAEETPETVPMTESTTPTVTLPETTVPAQPTQPTNAPEAPVLPPIPEETAPKRGGAGILITALLVLLVWAQRKLRLVLRSRWLSSGTPNQRALRLWAEALRLSRLRKQDPPEALEQLAQKAKFSQYTLEGEELAQFDAYLTQSRAKLRRSPWYWQLLYRWLWVIY